MQETLIVIALVAMTLAFLVVVALVIRRGLRRADAAAEAEAEEARRAEAEAEAARRAAEAEAEASRIAAWTPTAEALAGSAAPTRRPSEADRIVVPRPNAASARPAATPVVLPPDIFSTGERPDAEPNVLAEATDDEAVFRWTVAAAPEGAADEPAGQPESGSRPASLWRTDEPPAQLPEEPVATAASDPTAEQPRTAGDEPGAAVADPRVSEEVRALVDAGDRIGAIELLRTQAGLGLWDAKAIVDSL